MMPIAVKERTDMSIVGLLRATGYLDTSETIAESSIETYLRAHPELVDAWVGYSEDQRGTPAWYLLESGDAYWHNEGWVVGFLPESGTPCLEQKFTNGYEACAHFIKRYIELLSEHA